MGLWNYSICGSGSVRMNQAPFVMRLCCCFFFLFIFWKQIILGNLLRKTPPMSLQLCLLWDKSFLPGVKSHQEYDLVPAGFISISGINLHHWRPLLKQQRQEVMILRKVLCHFLSYIKVGDKFPQGNRTVCATWYDGKMIKTAFWYIWFCPGAEFTQCTQRVLQGLFKDSLDN